MHGRSGPRIIPLIIVGALVLAAASTAMGSDMGQAAAGQVNEASYHDFLENWLYAHDGDDRGSGPEHDLARDNIAFLFESYGLSVTLEPFDYWAGTYYNVVGTKWGTIWPDQVYIVGAHYDSLDNPGADDDASGVALLLETARILCQYDAAYTLRFVAFDRKEQALSGSLAYVDAHLSDDICGMIQADMIAYDPGTDHALIYGRTDSAPIKDALGQAIDLYGGGLTHTIGGRLDLSDHAPFEDAGFQACLLVEGEVWSNPYHGTAMDSIDNPDNINDAFAVKMVRSVVGFLVDHAEVNVGAFTYPQGRPEFISPDGGTQVRVVVAHLGGSAPEPGTGLLHYDVGGGFETVPMEVVSENVYDAVFPAVACTQEVSYYVSAEAVGGEVFTDPEDAPATCYAATAAFGRIILLDDSFETHQGWTSGDVDDDATTGTWNRGDPEGTTAQPEDDHTPEPGAECWVTDSRAGFAPGDWDVDGGKTTLKSIIIDLSDTNDATISYFRWYSNDAGAAPGSDVLVVDVSNDGGATWVNVETIGPSGPGTSGGWIRHEFRLADYGAATDEIMLRFIASDDGDASLIEAAIDDFLVTGLLCDAMCPDPADGDMNDDGHADGIDIPAFVLGLLGDPTQDEICHGDFNGDRVLDADDIPDMVNALLSP